MKRLLITLSVLGIIASLYLGKFFVINAAQINVHDMDVKVIYHYEDDYEFVGYNERSRVHFEEGHIGFQNNYKSIYQDLVDSDKGKYYHLDFKDDVIETQTGQDVGLELCIYKNRITKEIIDTAFLKDNIHFEFDGTIDAYVYDWMGDRQEFTRYERDFRIQGDFEITGIYDDAFVDYQIKRLIIYKLIYTADDYFMDYHGVTRVNMARVNMMRVCDGIIRYFAGLPFHSAWKFENKEDETVTSAE